VAYVHTLKFQNSKRKTPKPLDRAYVKRPNLKFEYLTEHDAAYTQATNDDG